MQSEEKLCVVVLFGGMSSEHEVSCVSAGTFVDNLDPSRYEVLTVGITKEGRWLCTELPAPRWPTAAGKSCPATCPVSSAGPCRPRHDPVRSFRPGGKAARGCRHPGPARPVGEDGTVQGLLELAGIPTWLRRSGQRRLHG